MPQITVYIKKEDIPRWVSIENKAEFIRRALDNYKPEDEQDKKFDGFPCCKQNNPCKHWQWDTSFSCYVNTITGEHKEDSSVVDVHEL